ncbi:MAG: hypothetical protein WAX69_09715 [Victivallales bacterium]
MKNKIALEILGVGVTSLIGCGIFLSVLFLLHKIDGFPWIVFFAFLFLLYMTAAYSIISIFSVCFSILPFWRYLHNILICKKQNKYPTSSITELNQSDKKNGRLYISSICLFAFMVSAMNLFAMSWNIYSYYISKGDGVIVEVTWKSMLVLDNGQRIPNPINDYDKFPWLKPIKTGDRVEKKTASTTFFVNGQVYFDKKNIWEQELNSHFYIFIIFGICVGLLMATIYKLCYPDELLNIGFFANIHKKDN